MKKSKRKKLKRKLKRRSNKIQEKMKQKKLRKNDSNFFFEKEMSELIGFHLPFEEALEHPVS